MSVTTPLPRLLVMTDRAQCAPRPLVDVVRDAVAGGARAVVLREKDLDREARVALADRIRPIVHDAGGFFLVASDATIESDGVHLASTDRFPDNRPRFVGRSCHTLDDVHAAEAEGCDYVTVSPVFSTDSKPGYGPALGLAGLRAICAATRLPVYALGGVSDASAAACHEAGAAGVAMMGAIMRPGKTASTMQGAS